MTPFGEVMAPGETALAFMQALWASDTAAADSMLTDDATWAFQLGMPQAALRDDRIWPAREAMRQIIADLFGLFDPEGFSVETTRIIVGASVAGQDRDVAIEYQASGRTAKGAEYRNFYVTLLRVRGDKISDIRPFNDTQHMLAMLAPAGA